VSKGNREKKKPKQEKPKPAPAASPFPQQLGRSPAHPSGRQS
jgi:hypothetical protein